jgi:polyphosphate glucokinase
MKNAAGYLLSTSPNGPRTLVIDVGGTGLKASVLDGTGRMVVPRVRLATPYPCRPATLLRAIADLIAPLPPFDRISSGFPGVIHNGRVITAPHFDAEAWRTIHWKRPSRANSASRPACSTTQRFRAWGSSPVLALKSCLRWVQASVARCSAMAGSPRISSWPITRFTMTRPMMTTSATRPASRSAPESGTAVSSRRSTSSIPCCITTILYLGGGNAARFAIELPDNVRIASNDAGITGGIRLWDEDVWPVVRDSDGRNGPGASAVRRLVRTVAPPRRRSTSPPADAPTPS